MSSNYQDSDRGHFDYDLHPIPGIPDMMFRGPRFDPSRPYVACIGAAQTFGRFCARPFPTILRDRFDFQFVNLGIGGVGARFFDASQYLKLVNTAEFAIVQVLSGRSEGNSLFDNTESGGLLGVRVRDNKRMRFEDFLADLLATEPHDLVGRVIEETRKNYVENTLRLLRQIKRPKVLFWFSTRVPDYRDEFSSVWDLLGEFPQLVNRTMVDQLRTHTDDYVECVSTAGLPQQLWESNEPIDGTTIQNGNLINRYYPSPQMQQEAADVLEPVCRPLLPARRTH